MTEEEISKTRLNYLKDKFDEKYSIESLSRLVGISRIKKFSEIISAIYLKEKSLLDEDRKKLGRFISKYFYPNRE